MNATQGMYVDKVEAWEYCESHGINELPRKGKEIATIYAKTDFRYIEGETPVIGKDENGFYIGIIES